MLVILHVLVSMPLNIDLFVMDDIAIACVNSSFIKEKQVKVLNYPIWCICVFVAELNRAGLEPGDTEQAIHHLHRELLEAQELANTGKQRCLELQGNITLQHSLHKQLL